jgi:apolipoprotein N-acyltransferase
MGISKTKGLRLYTYFKGKISLAFLSGILLILIFPKFNLELLGWIAVIPLFHAIREESLKNAFWLGWSTGVTYFLGSLYWITVTMIRYGGINMPLSTGILLLLAVYLALYIGIFALTIRYLSAFPIVVTAPVVWVALEYIRSFFFIGFPWNSLGYSQFLTSPIVQIAEFTSVYGVSFLLVLINATLYTVFFSSESWLFKKKLLGFSSICLVLTLGRGFYILNQSVNSPKTFTAAVVQGNIDQGVKWESDQRDRVFNIYKKLSLQTLSKNPNLIVWPETAVPFFFNFETDKRTELIKFIQDIKVPIVFGGIDAKKNATDQGYLYRNSAFFLSPEGKLLDKYDKISLVPFGEYVPYKKILFFVDKITTAVGELEPGDRYAVMTLGGDQTFGVVICFEVIFPNLVRKFIDRGGKFMVNITNDGWFGRTAGPYQHLAMATFRSIENRVPIVRAANTGISGFIDSYGRITASTNLFVEDVLTQDISLGNSITFYTQFGDIFAYICLGLFFVMLATQTQRTQSLKNFLGFNNLCVHCVCVAKKIWRRS